MPYTKQDCLDKIQDISTNSQKCNKVVRALGVNVADDASLADLSTNIASIDTTFHPDYELPWIMAMVQVVSYLIYKQERTVAQSSKEDLYRCTIRRTTTRATTE